MKAWAISGRVVSDETGSHTRVKNNLATNGPDSHVSRDSPGHISPTTPEISSEHCRYTAENTAYDLDGLWSSRGLSGEESSAVVGVVWWKHR